MDVAVARQARRAEGDTGQERLDDLQQIGGYLAGHL